MRSKAVINLYMSCLPSAGNKTRFHQTDSEHIYFTEMHYTISGVFQHTTSKNCNLTKQHLKKKKSLFFFSCSCSLSYYLHLKVLKLLNSSYSVYSLCSHLKYRIKFSCSSKKTLEPEVSGGCQGQFLYASTRWTNTELCFSRSATLQERTRLAAQ